MSHIGHRPPHQTTDEKEFLTAQLADASIALSLTTDAMKETLSKLSPARLCQRHPLAASGCAVVAGFVTGFLITPSRNKPGRTCPTSANAERDGVADHDEQKQSKSALLAGAGTVLAGVLKPVVQGFMIARLAPRDVTDADPHACQAESFAE